MIDRSGWEGRAFGLVVRAGIESGGKCDGGRGRDSLGERRTILNSTRLCTIRHDTRLDFIVDDAIGRPSSLRTVDKESVYYTMGSPVYKNHHDSMAGVLRFWERGEGGGMLDLEEFFLISLLCVRGHFRGVGDVLGLSIPPGSGKEGVWLAPRSRQTRFNRQVSRDTGLEKLMVCFYSSPYTLSPTAGPASSHLLLRF